MAPSQINVSALWVTVIPLGGRQVADRESEHCQPDANEILPG
jgi:hypothetical protein